MNDRFGGFRIALVGFASAFVGVAAGFAGFHFELRWLALTAFVVTVPGVVIGFVGVIYGWVTQGKAAISGSAEASRELRSKIRNRGR